MISVTVKTLDSQNHHFSVPDTFTVEQFKNHIADKVNVAATRQRIIYCGRVLQDSSKLADCDVDGKVVHLVQRAPPNSTPRNVRSITPPPDLNRARGGFRGFDRMGNTVYMGMGSMTFPPGLMDPQQMIPPRATHTLSSSRLNVAKRMLRNAENVIQQLENPPDSNEVVPPPEEPAEEEMTPVIEARVIVPTNGDQPIDENSIINAVQNTIFPAVGSNSPVGPSTSSANTGAPTQPSNTSTPEMFTSRSFPTENVTTGTTGENPRDNVRQSRTCRGTEMATLLTTLNQLQFRFSPFLARYQAFMQDDPQVASEDLQETRQMLNRVSQVLHFLGHAYHSLSDIIINADDAPPRLLLCRPILIQPPAVVQAGIPIQVEAQINLSAERPGSTTGNTTTTFTGTTTNSSNTNSTSNSANATNTATAGTRGPSQPQQTGPSITLQPGFVGLPFMPTGSMRVITTPVEIRTLSSNASRPRSTNNNNNTPFASSAGQNTSSATPTPPEATQNNQQEQNEGAQNQNPPPPPPPNGHFGPNSDNLEFFMEVTPEALRGGNLIQSIMQLVGSQLGDTINQVQNQRTENASQANQPGNAQGQSQQSQARSTQTNPTTATHTRSTPRPHVHMTQQAVQGGFDPFLHCYSHHVSQSRPQRIVSIGAQPNRQEASRETNSASNQPNVPTNAQSSDNASGGVPPNIAAHIENITEWRRNVGDLPHMFDNRLTSGRLAEAFADAFRHRQQATPGSQGTPQRGAPDGQSPLNQNASLPRLQQDIFRLIGSLMDQDLPDLFGHGPTLDVYLQLFHPEPYVQGESLIIDLIMMILRNLRINDLFMISSGNMAPLQRQIDAIQGFFLTEICQNDTTDAGISRATERIMNDFRPIISVLEPIPPRENINIARTIENLFRQRLPDIIRLPVYGARMERNTGQNTSVLLTAIWRVARELLALAIHCSANGQQGVETVCEQVLFSTIFNQTNVPNDMQHWIISSSRIALRTIIQNLDVRPAEVEQYVIRNTPQEPTRPATQIAQQEQNGDVNRQNNVESMEVDYVASPTNAESLLAAPPIRVDNPEPLPNVIWGSEPWHRQTPEEWVPIITRDIQKQRRQSVQLPFSDAYVAGMPSKRRKLINNAKPQGSLPQIISESIQQAVTSTGLTSSAPLEVVARAASDSPEIQSAYRNLLESTITARYFEDTLNE